MDEKTIARKVARRRQEIIDFLSKLVAIPTPNPPGRNSPACVSFLSNLLRQWRIEHKVILLSRGKYPRYALLGSVGKGEKNLHFHGHYDVVPASFRDAFLPRLEGDRLYGRGSSDMKGGLAAMLFALRLIKDSRLSLAGRLTFSIVPDEESGGRLGTEELFRRGILPPAGTVGMLMPEPTSGRVWNGNKGALTLKVRIQGRAAHIGLAHQGVNAYEQMVELAQGLLRLKKAVERRKTGRPVSPPQVARSIMLVGGESGSGACFNAVPDKAFFTIDRRFNPEETIDGTRKEIEDILQRHRLRGREILADVLQAGEASWVGVRRPLALALRESITAATGRRPKFELCPGLCEIRFFNNRGHPAYAYGPGLLEVSHGPSEYVVIQDILVCAQVYVSTARRILSRDY